MRKSLPVLMLMMLLAVTACSKSKTTKADESKEGASAEQALVINNYTEPDYLDPALSTEVAAAAIVVNLFEGLTAYDPKDLKPGPGVAETWDISPDGKTYTFHLRKDAKWSDGSKVTAHDFVYSWQRALNPETAAKYAYQLFYIKNGNDINKGKIKDLSKLGAKAIDEHTLQVELENPTPFFLSIVGFHTLFPVKKSVVEKHGRKWTRPENMVGNGYFRLTEWIPSKQIVVEKNPHYWGKDDIHLDKVSFLAIEDRETALKSFLKGDVHFINDPPAIKLPQLRKHPELQEGTQLATYYILTNTKKKPTNDKLVRQALAQAIDRKQLVKVMNKGLAWSSFTPDDTAGYHPPKGFEFNPANAKKLLAEAGYSDPKTFPSITLVYNTSENHKMIMEIVQSMWKQNLGINVKLLNMEWKVLLKTLEAGDFQASRFGWVGDYFDPNTFLDIYLTGGGNNHSGWGKPEYDALIKKAAETTDQAKRFEYFHAAEKMLLEDAAIIPLYTYTRPIMLNKRVSGLYNNALDLHPLKGTKIAKQ